VLVCVAVTGQMVVPTTMVSVVMNVDRSLAGQSVTDAAQDVIVRISVVTMVDVVNWLAVVGPD
jgi:hypothetical protein